MDYFNEKERAKQKKFAAVRDRIFAPVVALLVRYNVTPNQVSMAGVVLLLAACLVPAGLPVLIALGVGLYVLCDGVDGPLARAQGRSHSGGSLIDIVADQLGVVFLPAAACHHFGAWAPGMVVFASFYLIFIALVVYANGINVPLRGFIRTKYFFFGLYVLSAFMQTDYVTYFGTASGVYYMIETFLVLRRIYAHHDALHAAGAACDADAAGPPLSGHGDGSLL